MGIKRCFLLFLAGLLVLLAFTPSAIAQGTSGIKAKVIDKDGSPLPSARITVTNPTLGITQSAVTDADGTFRIVPLPPGKGYSIQIDFPGMSTIILPDLELTVNRVATMPPITLRPKSEVDQSIRVTATRDVVDTSSTSTTTSFSSEFIDSLPILGRNYQDVLTLAPGVQDTDGDGNPNIHGARDTDVNTLVDGVSTVDPLTGLVGQQLNIESIQEIEIKTAGATAEFSRGQGGFVNIVTKSGGNDFEGSFRIDVRTQKLDGDGAGIRDPSLSGGLGEIGLRDLDFKSYQGFLSLSGPIVRDKAWYFVTFEDIHDEEPINALTQAFIQTTEERRIFGKMTWDMATNHTLVFTATVDPQEFQNIGVTSFIPVESGWTVEAGGVNLVLRETAVLSPNLFLETTLQSFASEPAIIPNLNPDSNGNGVLFIDRNGDGFLSGSERDPGEDFDRDGRFDIFEDKNGNGFLDKGDQDGDGIITCPSLETEDADCDGRLTIGANFGQLNGACEGVNREDLDCDGNLDRIDEDPNRNGICDIGEPCDVDNDGRIDRGNEDRNGNNILDDRPFPDQGRLPTGVTSVNYPYGSTKPITFDRDYTVDLVTQRTDGPYFLSQGADTSRITLRSDLTQFIPDWHGQHDMKMGAKIEFEEFDQTLLARPIIFNQAQPASVQIFQRTLAVSLPSQNVNANSASNTTLAFYVTDTYKPLPNLTLNVGVRIDREAMDTFGFTYFDPAAERASFDRLQNLLGGEAGTSDDVQFGNNDGFLSNGICGDPLFSGFSDLNLANVCEFDAANNPGFAFSQTVSDLQSVSDLAATRLTQHHFGTTVVAKELEGLFPNAITIDPITGDKVIDRQVLQDQGVVFQEPETFRITNSNLAPRLAVSWDPWSDGKTKVFATWGRFYDKLFLNTVVGEEGPDNILRYYLRDDDGVTATGVPNNTIGNTISKAPPNFTQVDRGLATPYSDEWTIGFERELGPELSLSLTFINRDFRDQLQDKDINHEVRFDANGQMLDRFGNLLIPPGSTSGTPSGDGKPDLFIHNFFFNQILRVGNFNEARYKAFELQVTKRLSRKWQLDGSYTYARALGDAENFLSQLGDDPATAAFEYGPLNFDQRHTVRLNAITFLPGDWQLGSTVEWNSGFPFSTITTALALDNFQFPQNRVLFGTAPVNPNVFAADGSPTGRVFEPETRNSQRNDSWYNINILATKSFVLGRFNSRLFFNVENLLNSDDLTITSFNPGQSNTQGNLELISTRRFGRRFEIGFQIEF